MYTDDDDKQKKKKKKKKKKKNSRRKQKESQKMIGQNTLVFCVSHPLFPNIRTRLDQQNTPKVQEIKKKQNRQSQVQNNRLHLLQYKFVQIKTRKEQSYMKSGLTRVFIIQAKMTTRSSKALSKRKHNTRRKSDKKRQETSVSEDADTEVKPKSKQAERRAEKARQKDKTVAYTPDNVLRQAQILADARKAPIAEAVTAQQTKEKDKDTAGDTPDTSGVVVPSPSPVAIQQDTEMTATTTTFSPSTLTDNAQFFSDPDYVFTFELVLNDQILKEKWKLRDICDHMFGLYGDGDHMTSSFDFNTGIAQISFLSKDAAQRAQGYRGAWGLPLKMVAALQHHTNKKLEFAGAHGAMLTHFSKFSTPDSIATELYQKTLVKPLGVLLLGPTKATALISVASEHDLAEITRTRRFVLHNHLVRIVPKRPFKAAIVYVSNLPTVATEDKVERMLAAWGVPPLSVLLPTNESSGKALGFGFVTYKRKEQADKLIALDGKHNVCGHALKFEKAKRRKRKPQRVDRTQRTFVEPPKGPTSRHTVNESAPTS